MDAVSLALANTKALQLARLGRPSNRAVVFGNSIPALADTIQNGVLAEWYQRPGGIWWWANQALRQRFNLVANTGVSGNTTTQMLARFSTDVLAYAPDWLVMFGIAINDIQGGAVTLATIEANCTAMWSLAHRAGIKMVICTDTSSGAAAGQLDTAAKKQMLHDFNRFVVRYCRDNPGTILVDWAGMFTDPSSGLFLAGMTDDGTHPNATGASKLGLYMAAVLDPLVPRCDPLPLSNIDTSNFATNGMMLGNTAGLATGLVASTGPAQDGSAGVVPVYTATKVARTDDFGGEWQQIALTSGDLSLRIFDLTLPGNPGFVVGDTVYAMVEFETDAAGWANATLQGILQCLTSGFANVVKYHPIWPTILADVPARAPSGIMLFGPLVIPATTARLDLFVYVQGSFTSGSGTVRIGRHYVAKAPV